jgi:hypothetical protein
LDHVKDGDVLLLMVSKPEVWPCTKASEMQATQRGAG